MDSRALPCAGDMLTALAGLTDRAGATLQRLATPDDLPTVHALYRTFDGFTERVRYNHLPAALLTAVAAIRVRHPADEPRLLRLLVLHALTQSIARLADGTALPAPLAPMAVRTLTVLQRSLETESDERYHVGDDRYVKDLHVARLRLVPLGAQLLDTYRGYSRKPMLVGGGFAGAPRALLALVRHGGNNPWHEFHTYDLAMRFFGAKGWEESIRLCIPLLQQQPEVKGIFASAWWFDPALGRLTPNMAFPRDVSARFGAKFFPLPPDVESNELAVLRSPERAALVASGRYAPRPYLMLLPRDTLLAHA